MAKYSKYEKKEVVARYKIHPIWRGVGFLLMLFTPIIAWLIAEMIVPGMKSSSSKEVHAFMVALAGKVTFPEVAYKIPLISSLASGISSIEDLKAKLFLTVGILIVISGVLSVVYAALYSVVGPPRYGPLDAPPPKIRAKKYKR